MTIQVHRSTRRIRRIALPLLARCVVATLVVGAARAASTTPPVVSRGVTGHRFVVFDALLFKNKPNLMRYGLAPLPGSGALWTAGHSKESIDIAAIRAALDRYRSGSGYFYFDIENWPTQFVSPDVRAASLSKLIAVARLARAYAPSLRIGFYGLLPGTAYWPLLLNNRRVVEWQEANWGTKPLATYVDALFPSLYTYYDDPRGWRVFAQAMLAEARIYGRPIYPFLWPQFHDSNRLLRGQYIPPQLWRAELELCYQFADGVVLWGGWQQDWNPAAPWWQETRAFMARHHLSQASASR